MIKKIKYLVEAIFIYTFFGIAKIIGLKLFSLSKVIADDKSKEKLLSPPPYLESRELKSITNIIFDF